MSDFVEVTKHGFGSRSKGSIGGAIFGLFLIAGITFFLFRNEGRAVKRYKDLKEGAGLVVTVSSDTVDPAMEGKLVHLTGESKTKAPLVDGDFGVSVEAVKLLREAEMYQWVEVVKTETRNKTGGGSEQIKTYSYERQWRDSPVDSSQFKVGGDHRNPGEMKYRNASQTASEVTLGAFSLPAFLVSKIGGAIPLVVESIEGASESVRASARIADGGFYFGNNPASPAIGDLRVRFLAVPTGPISVVAQQAGASFVPFTTKTGGSVDLLERGQVSAADMFQLAQDRNKMLTWAIRVGGFFLLGVGFSLVLAPVAVLASILPFLGRLVGAGTKIVAFLLAGIVWAITVSVAWIFYRPVLGIAILAVAIVLFVLVMKRLRKPSAASLQATPPPLN